MNIRHFFILFFLFSFQFAFSQADTAQRNGTIKIVKKKSGPVYIKAAAEFGITGPDRFQPFPVVEGHAFPFSYTKFFNDYFKNKKISLAGKNADTVRMEVSISKKAKVRIRDVTSSFVNGKRVYFDGTTAMEPNALHVACFDALMEIQEWYPAYDMNPQVGKYKGQTVIRPVKTTRDATGVITIVFSYEPFDE